MKLVFCGTPQFAAVSLEKLSSVGGFDIQLVVTQPDRPQGRGMQQSESAVKQSAIRLGLPLAHPEKIKTNQDFQQQLASLNPDAIVIVGYGRIIPPWMLRLPPLGNINLHASLLPKYRGAAPIQWAIAQGETVTGITTMRIDEGLDTGDILLQKEMSILSDDTSVTLAPRLASLGADLLVETMRGLEHGTIQPIPQNNAQASLAPILTKEDGRIDFSRRAPEICNRLRGFQPWPGAYTRFKGRVLKVISAQPAPPTSKLAPGELQADNDRLFAGCTGDAALELLQVQPEGKKAMSAREFVTGYRPAKQDLLN